MLFWQAVQLPVAAGAELKDEFLAKYEPAARQLADFYGSIHIKGTYRRLGWPADKGKDWSEKIEIRTLGEMLRLESASVGPQGESHVARVVGAKRSFVATKTGMKAPFALARLGSDLHADLQDTVLAFPATRAPFGCFEKTVYEWLSDSSLNIIIVGIEDVEDPDAGHLARLSYERVVSVDGGSENVEAGLFVFHPERSWALREYSIGPRGSTVRRRGMVTYEGAHGEVPLLKRVDYWRDMGGGKRELIEVFEVDELSTLPVPASDFTLEAFGIPDVPIGGNESRNRFYLVIGSGLGLLVLAWLAWKKGKRSRVESP